MAASTAITGFTKLRQIHQRIFSWQNVSNFSTTARCLLPRMEVDGVNLNYEVVGDGPHNVLLSPGLAGTVETDFGKFLEKADKKKFRWIAWDPPGYGKSRPPARSFKGLYVLTDAHYAAKLMQNLGIEKYSIFGWSQGGGTAIFLAAEYPSAVINFVTLGSGSCNNEQIIRVYKVISEVEYWPEDRLKEMLAVYDKAYLKKMMKDNYQTNKSSYQSSARGEFYGKYAEKVICPAIHMHGEVDRTCPKMHAYGLKSRIKNAKNSRVVIIPNAGHDLHLTHTKEFLDIVEPFFLNEQ